MRLKNLAMAALALSYLSISPIAKSLSAEDIMPRQQAVLIELFTSEGCSSCPPADALLGALDRRELLPDANAIVLSEHVDYWNHGGWRDPYSSSQFSTRQLEYTNHFRLDGPYTPQMVVDGTNEFVGSDAHRARAAIEKAAQTQKAVIRVKPFMGTAGSPVRVHVEIDAFSPSITKRAADVYFAVAENEASSQVAGGENRGRRLHHVAVVRSLTLLGTVSPGSSFDKDVPVKLDSARSVDQVRFIAFVQEREQGRVLGAAMHLGVTPTASHP